MIIHIESNSADSLASARESLEELIDNWGYQLQATSVNKPNLDDSERENKKSVDPVAIAALIVSIPSAALAVTDLTDRIRKRKRAQALIDKIRESTNGDTVAKLITKDGPRDLSELNPDQLLDVPRPEDPPA